MFKYLFQILLALFLINENQQTFSFNNITYNNTFLYNVYFYF